MNQRESLSLIPAMDEKVLAIDAALHELDLYVGGPRTPALEHFQRWLETRAHSAAAELDEPPFDRRDDQEKERRLACELLIAECRVATKLLMQFKLEQGV